MARRKRGRKMSIVRKVFKGIAQAGSKALLTGPAWIPAIKGIQSGVRSGAEAGAHDFVIDATGYDISTGQFNQQLTQNAVLRAIAMVGFGLALSWISKRV